MNILSEDYRRGLTALHAAIELLAPSCRQHPGDRVAAEVLAGLVELHKDLVADSLVTRFPGQSQEGYEERKAAERKAFEAGFALADGPREALSPDEFKAALELARVKGRAGLTQGGAP